MEVKIVLDPRLFTGELDHNTPNFIIHYIATYCRIEININYMSLDNYFTQIISSISEYEFAEISLPLKVDDMKKVIRFISPYSKSEEWSSKSIILAIEHMISFMNFKNTDSLENKLTFGNKSNNNPLALNCLIVYKICKVLGYPILKTTTIEELNFFVFNKFSNKIDTLRVSLINKIIDMDETTLSHTYYTASKLEEIETNTSMPELPPVKFNINNFDSSMIEFIFNDLNDTNKILNRITPKSINEVIIIAARIFNINISDSSIPVKELDALRRSKKYTPLCNSFCSLFLYNKQWYNVKSTWCKIFSPFIYSNEQLHSFAFNEGFNVPMKTKFSSSELHNLLNYGETINNFYFSRVPYAYNIKTTILAEEITTVPPNELICFGNISKREFIYITVDELNTFFKTNKIYIDPIDSNPLSDIAINKLKINCDRLIDIPAYTMLKETLTSMDNAKKLLDNKFVELKTRLLKEDEIVNDMVKEFFTCGIELGLYMRGWKVNDSEYTLTSDDTRYESGKNDVNIQRVFENTVKAKNRLTKSLLQIPNEISDIIRCLHALKFTKKDKNVTIFEMNVNGAHTYIEHTLCSCTELIFGDIQTETSCIRTLSNWILFSFTWYSNMLGYEVPFKIEKIDYIV